MAGSFTCDWCGHSIEDFSILNKVLCNGLSAWREWHLHRPGDGYDCMQRAVDAFDEICGSEPTRPTRTQTAYKRRSSARDAWTQLSSAAQEHQVLNALGAERQRPRDVTLKVNAMGWHVWTQDVQTILDQLIDRGDAERTKQPRSVGSSQHWWMYSRSSKPLSPELEALERSLSGAEAACGGGDSRRQIAIGELEIRSVRTYNALLRHDLETVGDIVDAWQSLDIWAIRGLGKKGRAEIVHALGLLSIEIVGTYVNFASREVA